MSPASFALTKIRPPRPRAQLVPRAALEEKLADALATRRLTLLSAPAGFGKTAALARQIERLPAGTALVWIEADDDDDLHRFLTCLFAALEPFDLPWRAEPDALVATAVSSRTTRRAVAGEVLNALAACDATRGLIVIDDAHRICDTGAFEFIDLLLERLPEHWGIVISARSDPPLALARLRALGDLVEIRQPDLCFSRDEVAALVASVDGRAAASELEVGRLVARTRGWAAGLRIMLSGARRGCGGVAEGSSRTLDRHVFDFLATEVLDSLEPELRDFLMRCSVLPELTADRCARVSGNPRAAQLLDEIERRDLFACALEGPEPTLTLHELFRECLSDRLHRETPDEVPRLLRLAAETEADPIRRLSMLLSAQAWGDAEAMLDEVAAQLLAGGAAAAVPRLIAQFPEDRRRTSPRVALVRALTAWQRWDWPEMLEATRIAVDGFARTGDEPRRQRALVLWAAALTGSGRTAESAAVLGELPAELLEVETRALALALHPWHALDSGDFGAVAGHYMKLLDQLEEIDSLQVWFHSFRRPLYLRLPGMSVPLERFVRGVTRRAGDSPTEVRVLASVMSAWLALWRGELREAMQQIAAAEAEARWFGMPVQLRMFIDVFLAAAHAMRGERDPAMQSVDALLGVFDSASAASRPGRTSMYGHYVFYGIRIADAVGDAGALRQLVSRLPPLERITNGNMLRAPLLTVPARLAAAEARHEQACEQWERSLAQPVAIDVIGQAHEARMRYAVSLLALGRRVEAGAALRPLLAEVDATGEIGGALLAGPRAIAQLAGAAWGNALGDTEIARLRDWVQRTRPDTARRPPAREGARLTGREIEILRRIAIGDSNKLIARALELSPHTVKRHVANILDKLDLTSRRQAADWYRAHA